VFAQIRKTGRVRRAEIGVNVQTVTPLMAEALGLTTEAGVILSDVAADGPAGKAGLQPGDLVLSLDGKRMENGRQFRINVYSRAVGEPVTLGIQRGDRRLTVRVPVVERSNDPGQLTELVTAENAIRDLGVLGLDLTPRIAQLLPPLRRDTGVVVGSVAAGTPYSQQGRLEIGDVIYAISGRPVASVADLKSAMAALQPNAPAVLLIERDSTLLYLAFRVQR
jgi:serine protease Do